MTEDQVQKIVEEVLKEILSDTGFQMWKEGSNAFEEEITTIELATRKAFELKDKEQLENPMVFGRPLKEFEEYIKEKAR